jgi:hypothetical protein
MATRLGFLYRARFAKAELEDMLCQARSAVMESGPESIMSWSDNSTSVSKRPEMTVAEWLDEIVYSLALIDPATYGDRQQADISTPAFPGRFT